MFVLCSRATSYKQGPRELRARPAGSLHSTIWKLRAVEGGRGRSSPAQGICQGQLVAHLFAHPPKGNLGRITAAVLADDDLDLAEGSAAVCRDLLPGVVEGELDPNLPRLLLQPICPWQWGIFCRHLDEGILLESRGHLPS